MAVLLGLANRVPGDRLTVLLRPQSLASPPPEKKMDLRKLLALGVQVVTADLAADSTAQLSALFARFNTVIGCTGFASGTPIQRKICQAVLGAGVARYVPWQFGVDYDLIGRGSAEELFDEQLDVRDLLRAQNRTEWVIISAGMFTNFLFEPAFGVLDLKRNIIHALKNGNTAITVTTAGDIGALTAEVLHSDPRIRNTVVYTAGDTITYKRFSKVVGDVLGRPFQCEDWSVPELEEALSQDSHNSMSKYRVVFAKGVGVSWPRDQTFNAQHHLAAMSVQQWAREHLEQLLA